MPCPLRLPGLSPYPCRMQDSHEEEVIYSGPATIEHQGGQKDEVQVRLWKTVRLTNRLALGEPQLLPRNDVTNIEGKITSQLHQAKLMQLAVSETLILRYDHTSWKISFPNNRSPQFTARSQERVA